MSEHKGISKIIKNNKTKQQITQMSIMRKAKQCNKHFNKQKHKPNPTTNSIPNRYTSPPYNNN